MTDVDELVRCITALLALNERNVLVPHGVPGLAKDCLKSAAAALERMRDDSTALRARLAEWEAKWRDEYVNAEVMRERLAELEAALREKDYIAYVIDGHGITHNTFTIVYKEKIDEL